MGMVLNKLKSNNGATLMLALLFFVVCAVTGSMILVSATASSGRLEGMKRRDQNYYAVMSAVKMCEQQMKEMNVAFTDQLVVTEVEVESDDDDDTDSDDDDDTDSSSPEGTEYTFKYEEQFGDKDEICKWISSWIKEELISNYQEKKKAANEKRNAFDLKWFKGVVKDDVTDTEGTATLKKHQTVSFSSQHQGENAEAGNQLEDLNVEIDVELTSVGVLTYKVYNADTINGKPNNDKYIMTLTVDIDVPCQSTVDVDVDEDVDDDGEHKTTTTTTTTTYTNEYTFDFKIRDIKKG